MKPCFPEKSSMSPAYIDAHSHLHGKEFDQDRELVFLRMKEKGVATITVGTDLEESKRALALAEESPLVWAAVGQHPVDRLDEVFDEKKYRQLLSSSRVVAIGECGLDYYRTSLEARDKERARQHDLFRRQIELSLSLGKPLMLHCRPSKGTMDAYEETLEILTEYKQDGLLGNVHFFVGSSGIAEQFLKLNFTFSFTGVITFTSEYDSTLKNLPKEAVLAETDAPYVAPVPFRGTRNEPPLVEKVVECIAMLRGEDIDTTRLQLVENTKRVFGLPS